MNILTFTRRLGYTIPWSTSPRRRKRHDEMERGRPEDTPPNCRRREKLASRHIVRIRPRPPRCPEPQRHATPQGARRAIHPHLTAAPPPPRRLPTRSSRLFSFAHKKPDTSVPGLSCLTQDTARQSPSRSPLYRSDGCGCRGLLS